MDKNLLLAVALSIGVYVAWFTFVEPPKSPQLPQSHSAAKTPAASTAPSTSNAPTATETTSPKVPPVPTQLFSLSIAKTEIKINPQGAALASYRYQGPLGPVELIPSEAHPGFFPTWSDLVFKRDMKNGTLVRYFASHPSGFKIEKEFIFNDPDKPHRMRITLHNPQNKAVTVPPWNLSIGPGLETVPSEEKENPSMWRAVGLLPAPPGKTKEVLQPFKPGEYSDPWLWIGVDNRYFLAALITSAAQSPVFKHYQMKTAPLQRTVSPGFWSRIFSGSTQPQIETNQAPHWSLRSEPETLAPNAKIVHEIPFYFGPKSYTRLANLGIGLERSVNFGWFDSLGRLTLKILGRLHRVTNNYGWSIILLTMLVQVLLSPLTYKSFKSMSAMKNIQPEMARLQQKFKDNPQRLHAEMMALYKSKGVNPLGGCLPMLVQMPVFVALFNALRNAWELHGAPWLGWVHDLSAHDPYYILPIFMGGVMFVQNKANPAASADPAQAKMMQWMPVIFTFMFLNFPAGIVLYWLTNSVLSLTQQMIIQKRVA